MFYFEKSKRKEQSFKGCVNIVTAPAVTCFFLVCLASLPLSPLPQAVCVFVSEFVGGMASTPLTWQHGVPAVHPLIIRRYTNTGLSPTLPLIVPPPTVVVFPAAQSSIRLSCFFLLLLMLITNPYSPVPCIIPRRAACPHLHSSHLKICGFCLGLCWDPTGVLKRHMVDI